MKLSFACYPCLLKQVLDTAELLGLNDRQVKTVIEATLHYLLKKKQDIMPLHIVAWLYTFIHQTFYDGNGTFDPYRQLKRDTNLLALEHFDTVVDRVKKSPSPLETALFFAAMGNIIDFGARARGSIDITHEIDTIDKLHFSIYHYDKLSEKLNNAETLLFIGDNAGEIVFDKVLIREVKKEFPEIDIVFAVRDRPIINDATIEDARFVGLEKEVTVVSSGSIYPGTILEETNEKFKELFTSADVIIAKGQGNFESLNDVKTEKLFFIFRIKCDRVADSIGVNNDDLILFQNI